MTRSDPAAARREATVAAAAMRRVMAALPGELKTTVRDQLVALGREPGRHNDAMVRLPWLEVAEACQRGVAPAAAYDVVREDGARAVSAMRLVRFWRELSPPAAPRTTPPSKEDRAEALGYRRWVTRGCYAGESREHLYVRRTALDEALDTARARRVRE